jgi:hypothetical protein
MLAMLDRDSGFAEGERRNSSQCIGKKSLFPALLLGLYVFSVDYEENVKQYSGKDLKELQK